MKNLEDKIDELLNTRQAELNKNNDPNYLGYLICSTDIRQLILDHNIETMQSNLDNSHTLKQTIIDICGKYDEDRQID